VAPPEIAMDTVVTAAREQVSSDLSSEVAILGLRRNVYYSLGGVGKRVWELVQTPRSVSEILSFLLTQYAVEAERCRTDLLRLLRQMQAEGLIDVVSVDSP
jgi:hypothetical protein